MAFGIDDALMAAAAGISLTDTCVHTIKKYRKKDINLDIEMLIEEVRVTALQRIDEADLALAQLERTLDEKKVTDMTLQEAISRTPFWRPFEAHRLKRIRSSFNALSDAIYSAIDDIASLVRCRDQTSEMGAAVVDSAKTKHELCQLSLYLRMDFSRYLRMVSKCNKGGAFAQQTKRFRSPRVVLESVNLDGPWRRGPQPRGRPHFKVKLPVSQGPGAFIRK